MTKEELEKEADEFSNSKKSFWKQGRTCIESVKQAYIVGATSREERIAKLEKENAELKEQIEEMKANQVVLNDFKSRVETVTSRFNKKSSQLAKAKEIIEKLETQIAKLEKISEE